MRVNYKRANNLLIGLIIAINGYILIAPFWPGLVGWWQLNHTGQRQQLQAIVDAPARSDTKPQPNHVVIPDMGLNAKIGEGLYYNRYAVLHKGIWRYNRGSTPDKGGNTVLVGHRFTYTNPRGIFYALNKVHTGSDIAVFWNGKKYNYVVTETKIVKPTDTKIQDPTKDARLTLYTCTPLFHPTSRLVVIAVPVVTPQGDNTQ
jgi:sortase A